MGARGRPIAERRGPKPQHKVAPTAPEYRELQRLARRRTASYAEVVRAKILLLAYEHPDWSNAAIARAVFRAFRAGSPFTPATDSEAPGLGILEGHPAGPIDSSQTKWSSATSFPTGNDPSWRRYAGLVDFASLHGAAAPGHEGASASIRSAETGCS
jgi:hypothetical protein